MKATTGAPDIYGNYFHLGWTTDDVRLTLGVLKAENVSTNSHFAEETGSIVLPYRVAKNVRDSLTRLVNAYENKNGEIKIPFLATVDDGNSY